MYDIRTKAEQTREKEERDALLDYDTPIEYLEPQKALDIISNATIYGTAEDKALYYKAVVSTYQILKDANKSREQIKEIKKLIKAKKANEDCKDIESVARLACLASLENEIEITICGGGI